MPARQPVAQTQTTTLAAMRDRQRVLLVFSNGHGPLAEQQLKIATAHAEQFRVRDLVLVGIEASGQAVPGPMLTPAEDSAARRRFDVQPEHFTVLLLGKDGGEKLRADKPVEWETLQRTIDAMPMRQDEMRRR